MPPGCTLHGVPYGQFCFTCSSMPQSAVAMPQPAVACPVPVAIDEDALRDAVRRVIAGHATVMPGDIVLGDSEGVYFIPPALLQQVVDNADVVHIHDEWTRKKFAEGKYSSKDIYSSPRDPALRKEYEDYLKKRLEEIRKQPQ